MAPQVIANNDSEGVAREVQERRLTEWRTGTFRAYPDEDATRSVLPTAHPATASAIGSANQR